MQFCKISHGDDQFGHMGVDLMFCSTLSSVLPGALAVLSAIFMVFTWHLVYPFNLGQCGEEVMWSMCSLKRKLANVSDAKGGPLSVDRLLGCPIL